MTALIHRSVFDVQRIRHGHPPGISGFMVLAKLDEMAEKPGRSYSAARLCVPITASSSSFSASSVPGSAE